MRDGAGAFYRAAGFQEELREQVATAAKAAFDDYVDAVVPTIFAQSDTDTDRMLSKEEFLHWVRRHPQALSWLENFATFVLSSVAVSDAERASKVSDRRGVRSMSHYESEKECLSRSIRAKMLAHRASCRRENVLGET